MSPGGAGQHTWQVATAARAVVMEASQMVTRLLPRRLSSSSAAGPTHNWHRCAIRVLHAVNDTQGPLSCPPCLGCVQFVSELRRTGFGDHLAIACVGSRRVLCINEEVRRGVRVEWVWAPVIVHDLCVMTSDSARYPLCSLDE
jgi:hypothetical protein